MGTGGRGKREGRLPSGKKEVPGTVHLGSKSDRSRADSQAGQRSKAGHGCRCQAQGGFGSGGVGLGGVGLGGLGSGIEVMGLAVPAAMVQEGSAAGLDTEIEHPCKHEHVISGLGLRIELTVHPRHRPLDHRVAGG